MATTYNNLYLDTRARLKKAGVEAAQLEARELLCYAADKSREQLYRDMPLYVSGELEKRVEGLVQRRLAGEPVAYIVGEWEFYGLSLDISSDVLIPRADTEVLAERAILLARAAGERRALYRPEEGGFSLAYPFDPAAPFPLTPLFCFASVRRLGGAWYAVFPFRPGGCPRPPDPAEAGDLS